LLALRDLIYFMLPQARQPIFAHPPVSSCVTTAVPFTAHSTPTASAAVDSGVATLPVSYSTFACAGLVEHVLPHYDIGQVQDCQFWQRGLSDVYWVETTRGRYVLRISHQQWRSRQDLEFELDLLEFLHERGVPVAYPLRTQGRGVEPGALLLPLAAPEGDRYASLFICAPGRVPVGDLNSAQSQQLGATVAQLHQVAQDFSWRSASPSDQILRPTKYSAADRWSVHPERSSPEASSRDALPREARSGEASAVSPHRGQRTLYNSPRELGLEYLLDRSLRIITPLLQAYPAHLEHLQNSTGPLCQSLQIPQTAPYWGICWGDPHSGNVHFTGDEQLMLFDFDQCGYGWRAFDVAKFYHTAISTGVPRSIRTAFLEGYQAIAPLTALEVDSLQVLAQLAHLWQWAISLEYASLHSFSRLDASYFTSRMEQFKRLQSHDWQLF
jgi:Ser/Thr protein kinase RdoA (MazF antagonist)